MLELVQNTPEWEAWRFTGVGASEVPAIFGVCPWGGTPYKVWEVKTKRKKGFAGNSAIKRGKELEAKARARYELRTMNSWPPACASHPKYTYLLSSLDGWDEASKKVLEIKCPTGLETLNAALRGEVIAHYVPQVQTQMLVTGADALDFFVYHDETKSDALVEVTPDLELQAKLIVEVGRFWNEYVLKDVPPPLTDKDVKDCAHMGEVSEICQAILSRGVSVSKETLDSWKAHAVEVGGHPKIKCGRVQISTVNRNGKFSYHKLTIAEEAS
jgi:putative phage-type endonuclease